MSPLWKRILDLEFLPDQLKHVIIAEAIKSAILEKSLPLGSLVPPYRKIADYMKIDKNIIIAVWRELRDSYELIITSRAKGTHIVSKLPTKKGIQRTKEAVSRKPFNPRKLQFDQETIMPFDKVVKGLDGALHKGSRHYTNFLNSKERKLKILPALVNQFRNMVNHATACSYAEDELYYCQGYELLIHNICSTLLTGKSVFVMANPASVRVKNAVLSAGNKLEFMASDDLGISMESLELICMKKKVGIVYMASRSTCPVNQPLSTLAITKLLALQRKYKFIIIEDDRYAGLYIKVPNLLMEMVYGTKAKVIYLCPVSFIHPDLNMINIMAAPAKLITEVRNKFWHIGKSVPAASALSLNNLIENGLLQKYELKAQRRMIEVVEKATRIFRESGLWKESGLCCDKGYFFYLEPRKGILPGNIFDLLSQAHIYVLDPADYEYGSISNNTIAISIAGYMDDMHLIHDLEKIHDFIRKIMS